jgi:hypothetical protein
LEAAAAPLIDGLGKEHHCRRGLWLPQTGATGGKDPSLWKKFHKLTKGKAREKAAAAAHIS